jgi:hypothetical protein
MSGGEDDSSLPSPVTIERTMDAYLAQPDVATSTLRC